MSLSKTHLVGLKSEQFRHPLDRAATDALKQIPGIDLVVRSLLGAVGEQYFYLENIASGVRVSDRQLPHLYELLLEAARVLDVEAPQLYVRQHPVPNAYTFAMRGRQPFIVVHTSLLDMLTPEEIQAVLAHELGHLKCEHGVYLTLANLIALLAGQLPNWGTIVAQSLQSQMLEWMRCAEFSCDRAALLATQNPRVVMSVLMKLAGGSPAMASQLNLDGFLEQARAYDEISQDALGEALKQMHAEQLSHPVPVLRAREIDRWAATQNYQDLLNRRIGGYNGKANPKGGWRNW
ncbi:M48 family metallopeptidase [Baaleninema sp.]|uniref:M48 family metallopeptidase n=1 Tax=Baaleninema sp. TaxID=3101197 RepID=UPI003CFF13DB